MALVVRAERVAEHRDALRNQLVVIVVIETLPPATLEQHDRQPRGREFLRHDAAAGTGADDDRVDVSRCHGRLLRFACL